MTVRISRGTYLQNLSGCKWGRFPYKILPPFLRILKLYIELLMGFSTYSIKRSQQPLTLSQCYVLETAPSVGIVSRMYISRIGGGEEPGSTGGPVISMTSSKKLQSLEFALSLLNPLLETFPTQFHFLSFCRCLGHLWTPYTIETANCLMPSFSLWLKLIHTSVLTPLCFNTLSFWPLAVERLSLHQR